MPPTVYIMQGVPGSGKSWQAQRAAAVFGASIVSADTYPGLYTMDAGWLRFDPTKIGEAHGACLRSAVEALQAGLSIIVDNTNTTVIEMAPYVALAQAYGAAPVIIRVECDPSVAFARNTHGVPLVVHQKLAAQFASFEPADFWAFIPGFELRTIRG